MNTPATERRVLPRTIERLQYLVDCGRSEILVSKAEVLAILADLKQPSEPSEHPDKTRMDWLERQHVEVRTPLVYGSRANFHASPSGYVEDPPNSDLRKRVDACLSATKQDDWCYEHGHKEHKRGSPACETAATKEKE
jgi:hypothetical protein